MQALWAQKIEDKKVRMIRINNETLARLRDSSEEAQRFKACNEEKTLCVGYRS